MQVAERVPARVATLVTRLSGGAGGLVVAGVCATSEVAHIILAGCDPAETATTAVARDGERPGDLAAAARAAGAEVLLVPWLRHDLDPAADLRALQRLRRWLEKERFPVVHTHCAKAGALGRMAAASAGVPRVVHTYHGFPFHPYQRLPRRAGYLAVERRLGRRTDVALCVGAAVAAEAVRRRLVAPAAARTIEVCVDGPAAGAASWSARDPAARQRARRRLGIAPEEVVVGAVGRCTYQKAPEDLLAAAARLARPGLVVVWVGGGELEGRLARLAARLPAGTRAVLAGERRDVLELLAGFDVFALPSRYEGQPTAVVEAMVCGVPVVATAVNGVADLVVPGQTGLLVPARRPAALAAAIGRLLDDRRLAETLATRAHDALGGRFATSALRASLLEAWGLAGDLAGRPPLGPEGVRWCADGATGSDPAALMHRTVRGLGA